MTFNFATPEPTAAPPPPADDERSGPHQIPRGKIDERGEEKARRRALLVGNPNVGKSVLFGALTGTYVTVSNYPGTTVEITRGTVLLGDGSGPAGTGGHASEPGETRETREAWEILDSPGTNNLVPMSEDEAVTRDILLSEPSDLIVQVGDAKNLTRTLLLTLQLAELGVPFLLNLNMADEARSRGIRIDVAGLVSELGGVRVNLSAATSGEGIEPVRAYLAERSHVEAKAVRAALPCAAHFPDDVEGAIAEIEAALPELPVAARGVATMLLSGDRGFGGWLDANLGPEPWKHARLLAEKLAETHGVPAFALLSKLRLARAQAIVRAVQQKADGVGGARAHEGRVPWSRATAVAAVAALVAGATYEGALALTRAPQATDPLDDYGFFNVVGRLASRQVATGWSPLGVGFVLLATVLGSVLVHRHASARAAWWKLAAAFALGYAAYWGSALGQGFFLHTYSATPVHLGAIVGLAALATWSRAGDRRDAAVSGFLGRYATHPRWGVPILVVVLFFAYKIVGVFGAGTAVDFLENEVFGNAAAIAKLDVVEPPAALSATDDAADGTERLVVLPGAVPGEERIIAQVKRGGLYVTDPGNRAPRRPPGGRSR
jgi:Fe2+ transport system protein B